MFGVTAKAPPSLAALSEARQLLAMCDDDKFLRKQLEKLAASAAEYRSAAADAEKAIAELDEGDSAIERALRKKRRAEVRLAVAGS